MEWYVRYVRKMAIPQQICLLQAVQVINYSVRKHEKSKGHEKSAAIAKVKSESTVNSDAYKILKTLNSENFEKLNKILPVHGSKVPTWVQSGVSPCGMPPVQKFAGKANVFLYLQQVMAPLQFSPVHCMLWNLK